MDERQNTPRGGPTPREEQIGGRHYLSPYQHLDAMDDWDIPYIEGYATKYLMRWRVAGKPMQDLEKSLHIMRRRIERFRENKVPEWTRPPVAEITGMCALNRLCEEDTILITMILSWQNSSHLDQIVQSLREMIVRYKDR